MSIYFADTSAIAKQYLPEIGAIWVQGWIERKSGSTIIISGLTVPRLQGFNTDDPNNNHCTTGESR